MKREINVKLSLKKCWEMVNRIQLAKSPEEIRERCSIAKKWLIANEVIDNEQYDELMNAVAYESRESYRLEGLWH